MGTFYYFAYGSTLDFNAFFEWCKQHSHPFPDLSKHMRAVLPDYNLRFNVPSKFWHGGVANIVPSPQRSVQGIVIELDESQLPLIRHKEGAQTGLYQELQLTVISQTGQSVLAVVYQGAKIDDSVKPSARYVECMIKGAQERGLPSDWIAELEMLLRESNPAPAAATIPCVNEEIMKNLILSKIPCEYVQVIDESGGCGAKLSATVVSREFEGVSLIDRHRRVNEAVKDLMPHIHALRLHTWTPAQFEKKQQPQQTQ